MGETFILGFIMNLFLFGFGLSEALQLLKIEIMLIHYIDGTELE